MYRLSPWKSAGNGSTTIKLPNGSTKTVNSTDSFGDTIRSVARSAGLSKFNVIIDGVETDAADAPNNFAGIQTVELKKYDEAA